jgi:hypothetical protein
MARAEVPTRRRLSMLRLGAQLGVKILDIAIVISGIRGFRMGED